MTREIAALLTASAALLASAGEPVVLQDFSDAPRFTLNGRAGSIADGERTLRIDTTGTESEWTPVLRTRPGVLKPGTGYVATFRYRVDSPDMENRFLHFLCRPYSAANDAFDTMRRNEGRSARFQPVRIKFHAGTQTEDYAFQIHVFRKLKGEITDFRLTEGTGETYLPATPDAKPFTGSFGKLPAGAQEFTINPPRNPDGATVDAAKFGVSPENPDNIPALNRAIGYCRQSGAAKLTVPAGTYRMASDKPLAFDRIHDFIFDGGGALFIWRKKRQPNFLVTGCERIVLRNFKMDWDWERDPLASLVEVAGTGPGHVDFKFIEYETFPRRDVRVAIVSSYDPAAKSVGIEGGFDRGFEFHAGQNRPETGWLSGNVLRVRAANLSRFQPGQLFRMQHYYYDMNGFAMSDNRHLTVEDVDIFSCAGHAFVINGVQQYWEFRRVNIAAPAGVPRRVITCTADHCHIARSRGFFRMEECEFSLGADDCLNAHDCSGYAEKSGTHSVRTRNMRSIETYRPDAPVELRHGDYSPAGFRSAVVSTRTIDEAEGIHEITFEDPVPDPVNEGFILFNWTYDTRNIIVRNCFFHDNRARGILLLGRDITIENNRFRHNEMGAVKIETGYTFNVWSEGYGADNIVVRGNTFDSVNPRDVGNDGKARDIYMGVYMRTDPSTERTAYPILSNILFENNLFRDSFGLVAFISSAGNVTFRNNTFENPTPRRNPLPFRGAFFVTSASDVKIVNNRYIASPCVPNPGVFFDSDSVKNLIAEGNAVIQPE
ncbi:MAG: right-handed parallel beta-helix repeat-containing protein [Lentisphaeria bacterium]|nr:right-handed parallel beta-helix repeat-containing protein [Lentisphaeria bacterium]